LIEGHCDERGTAEFNIQLGKRRANGAKKYISNLGVDKSRICTVSKGKEEPVVSNASSESGHQKNRRAVFRFVDSCP
jgi:peptidoglycan-associated lipoprotein